MSGKNNKNKKKTQSQLPVALVYSVALIICLAIFGGIGYLATKNFVPGAEAEEENYEEEQISFSKSDSMTILYTVANNQNELLSIVVARFIPSDQQIVIIPISPYTEYNGQILLGVYDSLGVADMTEQVGMLLGFQIDKYMTMTDTTFSQVATIIGTTMIDLKDDFSTYDEGTDEYSYYKKGQRIPVDGPTAAALLLYTEYPEGNASKMKMSGEVAAKLTNEFLSHAESAKNNVDALFKKEYADANTNMTTDEYYQMKSAIIYVIENYSTASPSYDLTPTGTWTEAGHFIIDDNFLSVLESYFNS